MNSQRSSLATRAHSTLTNAVTPSLTVAPPKG
jgi:hypothetical protein